jgi:uncharacterized protein
MPGGASKQRDVNKLSDAQAILELDVAVGELADLPADLVCGGGPLHVQVEFGRERGRMVAQVELTGELQLICQRCMQPMRWPVAISSSVVLVEAVSQADDTAAEQETVLAADGRLSIAALVGEELLLCLPIVPLHADENACAQHVEQNDEAPTVTEEVARPFADLRALLRQGTKPRT